MPQGIVKKWLEDKGYGFVGPDGGGEDVFVHQQALIGADALKAGERVAFDARPDERGGRVRASRCEVLGRAPGAAAAARGANRAPIRPPPAAPLLDGISAFPTCDPDGGNSDSVARFLALCGKDSSMAALVETFVVNSSLECPFLVVSDAEFVDGTSAPTKDEFGCILELVASYLDACEAITEGAMFVADFEGEMPGHGGELATAAFQLTSVVDPATLQPSPPPAGSPHVLGLLVDLRSGRCLAVAKRIMESAKLIKVMWGADGDCQSLMYQQLPTPLRMMPAAIVDAQLAFSRPDRRLGMGRMLKQVPGCLLAGLPEKEQVDWDAIHSCNRKALTLPLSGIVAAYAMDDLHRIEAILRSQAPPKGGYEEARAATELVLQQIRSDPSGIKSLQEQSYWFDKSSGNRRGAKAVAIMRHVISLRISGANLGEDAVFVEAVEAEALEELQAMGVVVPDDLSWAA